MVRALQTWNLSICWRDKSGSKRDWIDVLGHIVGADGEEGVRFLAELASWEGDQGCQTNPCAQNRLMVSSMFSCRYLEIHSNL